MIRNIIYFGASVLLFFFFMIAYGVILNSRGITLDEAIALKGIDSLKNVHLFIDRKNYKIELYSDALLIKEYKAVFGQNSGIIKTSRDDLITPAGNYKVCEIIDNYNYHKFIRLDFPNLKDASEALKNGYISRDEFKLLNDSYKTDECPPPNTKLGNDIGIHGLGEYDYIFRNLPFVYNWTNGSAAVSNKDIEELASLVDKGTLVIIGQ